MDNLDMGTNCYVKHANNNINIVIIKNMDENEEININEYITLIDEKIISKDDCSNRNINVIFIENIFLDDDLKSYKKIDNTPLNDDGDKIIQSSNNNINFMIIKNILPLRQ